MKKVAVLASLGAAASVVTVAALSLAQPRGGPHIKLSHFVDGGTQPAAPATVAPAAPTSPVESRAKRKDYLGKTDPQISAVIHANNKQTTAEERGLVSSFQHRVAVLYRIREIAETENDGDTKAKCDALLTTLDGKFFTKLRALNSKAPSK